MNASIPYTGKVPPIFDVKAKEVRTTPLGTRLRIALVVNICLVALFGSVGWLLINSFMDENKALTTHVASLNQQVSQLEADANGVDALRRELATTKADLTAEIARKNVLAVENTRLKGRVTQGERDLAAALQKLKVYEKPKARKK